MGEQNAVLHSRISDVGDKFKNVQFQFIGFPANSDCQFCRSNTWILFDDT
ncbi:hypothetical protein M2277_005831 [Paenibacillus sp. LBL]|nr:hypothetical protein [Paenibacillus sp. LBL]